MEIDDILEKHGFERATGRIGFTSPAYKLVCDALGIKWSNLTRVGKASLRGDMIDQYMNYGWVKEDGEYYLARGR